MLPGTHVELPDRGAARFRVDAVLGHVAVRADRHVKLAAVGARDDVLRPVMVDRTCRKIGDLRAGRVDRRCAGLVRKAQQRVGGRDI